MPRTPERGNGERALIQMRRVVIGLSVGLLTMAAQVAVSPQAADAATPLCFGKRATIVGTSGPDRIIGTDGPDVIVGLGGSDVISGRRGSDRICAGSNSGAPDRVYGGNGNDLISGGSGNDILRGDNDTDTLVGASGHDDLDGAAGPDVNRGGDGRDVCRSPSAGSSGASSCEPYCAANKLYAGIRIAERRVNTVEAQQSTPVCFAEADFMFTKDGHLVAAHDALLGGNCGDVREQTLARLQQCRLAGGKRVPSLNSFLAVPLTEWYIDLKQNQLAGTDEEILHTVEVAVGAIVKMGRQRGAVLMLYKVTPAARELIASSGVRAGMKGYPKTAAATQSIVDAAAANGFEMVCIRITRLDKAMLDYSHAQGVWHLAWELGEMTPSQWRQLIDQGLTGLLTARSNIPAARKAIFGT